MEAKILRINLTKKCWQEEKIPLSKIAGGRYLTSYLISREVPPHIRPFSEENKIVFACGPLAGQGISSASRLSVGSKSPLTGGIKEANAGGTAGDALAKLGWNAVILEGRSPEWVILVMEKQGVKFLPAERYLGLGNYKTAELLHKEWGKDYSLILIGPAGEKKLWASGVAVTDPYGRPSRMAARGGLGAVMGSKRVKGILLPYGQVSPSLREKRWSLVEAKKEFHHLILKSERIKILAKYGTAETLGLVNTLGALPTRNFRQGQFELAHLINGEALFNLIKERQGAGKHTEKCMAACLIRCSNVVPAPDGTEIVAPLEYETLGLMGANLGVSDLDSIARWNYYLNDLGLDTIEVGAALGVMAEAGLATFGEPSSFEKIILEIYKDGLLGRLAGMGASFCGLALGTERVPAIKGQAISAYDPRGVKGTGITYLTSPMGADHTAGLTVFAPVDHHAKEGQKELSFRTQIIRAAYDALGLCVFLLSATGQHPDKVVNLLNACYDLDLTPQYLEELGAEVISIEKAYNTAAGLPEVEELPEFMKEEPLDPYHLSWDIPPEELTCFWENLKVGGRNP